MILFGLNLFFMILSQIFFWGFENVSAAFACMGIQFFILVLAFITKGEI